MATRLRARIAVCDIGGTTIRCSKMHPFLTKREFFHILLINIFSAFFHGLRMLNAQSAKLEPELIIKNKGLKKLHIFFLLSTYLIDGNFSTLSDTSKWILSAGMILGRLELFAILVLFLPSFWKK